MTVPLSEPDRNKLVKLLSLLSSNHVGERDAAGAAAHRLLKQRGLDWEQVIGARQVSRRLPEAGWRLTCERLLQRSRQMTMWEREFVGNLLGLPRISSKQGRFLNEIADRVLGGGA